VDKVEMGKKQTKKLIGRFVKRRRVEGGAAAADLPGARKRQGVRRKGAKAALAVDKKAVLAPKVQTLIGRQKRRLKSNEKSKSDLKRKKENEDEDHDDDDAEKNRDFNPEIGAAVSSFDGNGQMKKKRKLDGEMTMEEFLTGGFGGEGEDENAGDSDDSSSSFASPAAAADGYDEEKEELEKHRKELQELEKDDPEFYKQLVKDQPELLRFGENEGSANGEDDEEIEVGKEEQEKRAVLATSTTIEELRKELASERPSRDAIKQMIAYFRVAVVEDAEESLAEDVKQICIESAISDLSGAFDKALGLQRPKVAGRRKVVKSHKGWPSLENLVKKFLNTYKQLIEKSTGSKETRTILLKSLAPYGIYICTFPGKLWRGFVREIISVWGEARDDNRGRLVAFLRLKRFATESSPKQLAELLKNAYLEFVRGAKSSSKFDASRISMQANCLVELFGVDLSVTYQLAFVYVRQLALHLRAAIISTTANSAEGVYNWQYLNCLRLWGLVLATYPGDPRADGTSQNLPAELQQLRSLIYPLIQTVMGVAKLAPRAQYFPVRLQCMSILNMLAHASKYYVPVSPLLLDVVNAPMFQEKQPSAGMAKEPNLKEIISLNKTVLCTGPAQLALLRRTLELLEEHFRIYRSSIGFPEMVFPIVTALRSYAKRCKVPRGKHLVISTLKTLTAWEETVKEKRSKADFSPSNIEQLHAFESEMKVDREPEFTLPNAKDELARLEEQVEKSFQAQDRQVGGDDIDDQVLGNSDNSKKSTEEKRKNKKKKNKQNQKQDTEAEDIVEDLRLDDL